jgi:hypothetical protein
MLAANIFILTGQPRRIAEVLLPGAENQISAYNFIFISKGAVLLCKIKCQQEFKPCSSDILKKASLEKVHHDAYKAD